MYLFLVFFDGTCEAETGSGLESIKLGTSGDLC